jgi:hypothetical protein
MRPRVFLGAVAALVALVACGAPEQNAGPNVAGTTSIASFVLPMTAVRRHPVGRLILMAGTHPDKGCPSGFVYCVTLSNGQPAQLYFCYSPGSYCGPSQYQYFWIGGFFVRKTLKHSNDFNEQFTPNPGDPTYDTIGEAVSLKSTHGVYKYAQTLCPEQAGKCPSVFYVGIAIK